jgi:hypothetical protein
MADAEKWARLSVPDKPRERIKVAVNLTIDVDKQAWMDTYGPNGSLRQDIKDYALGCVAQSAGIEECDGTVEATLR